MSEKEVKKTGKTPAKGKKVRKALTPEEKAAKAEKYNTVNENFRTINESSVAFGKEKISIVTQAAHVRGKGLLVREISSNGSISTVWIPGVKIKKKKAWNSIVEDKGPKVKKEKKVKS